MKKLLLISFVLLFAVSTFGQIRFGLRAGVNIANETYSASGMSMSPTSIIGFQAGAILECALTDHLFLTPGVLYSQKGAKIDLSSFGSTGTGTETLNYIDIPIDFSYKFGESSTKFFVLAGPIIGYALGGTDKSDEGSVDIEFGSNAGQYKRLDFAFGFGAGVDISSFQISARYNLGLANIINNGGADLSIKNNVIAITAAYIFGGK
jgi:hypothetical protein